MDDFEILGIVKGMTPEAIKKAHRALIKKHHPDLADDSAASHARMAEINAAFDRIKAGAPNINPQSTRKPRPANAWTPEDFSKTAQEANTKQSRQAGDQSRSGANWAGGRANQSGRSQYARNEPPKYTRQDQSGASSERAERVSEAARARAQSAGRQERPTERSYASEANMQPSQKSAMRQALEKRMQQEAFKRVTQINGAYPDPRKKINTDRGDLPGFHMVDKIIFKEGKVQLHLNGDAKVGRNIIAMPKMSISPNNMLHQSRDIHLVEVLSETAGKHSLKAQDEDGLKFELVFGQQKERSDTRNAR